MKQTLLTGLILALAASVAIAEPGERGEKGQKNKSWKNGKGEKQGWSQMDKRGGKDRPRGPMSQEDMEQMKADHQEIKALGEAARAVTNEAAKAEIVAQLRSKLGEVADRMLANQEKRLAQAEERLAGLTAKIEDAKTNRDTLIEEQVQRVLKGERPQRPDRFKDFPNAKGGRGDRRGRPDDRTPPPDEDMDDDMPTPPAE